MDVENMAATDVLAEIAKRRNVLMYIEGELERAKGDLKSSLLALRVEELKEQRKIATITLNALLGGVQAIYQPRLDMGGVLDEAEKIINSGALDTSEVTCSAEVHRHDG